MRPIDRRQTPNWEEISVTLPKSKMDFAWAKTKNILDRVENIGVGRGLNKPFGFHRPKEDDTLSVCILRGVVLTIKNIKYNKEESRNTN